MSQELIQQELARLRREDRTEVPVTFTTADRLRYDVERFLPDVPQLKANRKRLNKIADDCPANCVIKLGGSCTGLMGDENCRFEYIEVAA